MGLSYSQLEGLWIQAGGSQASAPIAAAIALAESGGNPSSLDNNPRTGDLSYGLWQINMIGSMGPGRLREFGLSSDSQLLDPLTNAQAAVKVAGGGSNPNFSPWTTFTSGKYLKYLQSGVAPNMTAGGAGGSAGSGSGTPGASDASATNPLTASFWQETIGNIGNYVFFGICLAGGAIILAAGLIMIIMSNAGEGVGAVGQLGRTGLAVATAGRKGSLR
jgi:hypothetical protein